MSIQEICELNSILQSDDRETVELQRKNMMLLGSIKQQEGRLQHELDEKHRFQKSLGQFEDQFMNLASEVEMTLISLNQLSLYQDKRDETNFDEVVEKYVLEKKELEGSIHMLLDHCTQAESRIAHLEESQPKNFKEVIELLDNLITCKHTEISAVRTNIAALESEICSTTQDHCNFARMSVHMKAVASAIEVNVESLRRDHIMSVSRQKETIDHNRAELQLAQFSHDNAILQINEKSIELEVLKAALEGIHMRREDLLTKYQRLYKQYVQCRDIVDGQKREIDRTEGNIAKILTKTTTLVKINEAKRSELQAINAETASIRRSHEITKRNMNFSEKASILAEELEPLRNRAAEYIIAIENVQCQLNGPEMQQKEEEVRELGRQKLLIQISIDKLKEDIPTLQANLEQLKESTNSIFLRNEALKAELATAQDESSHTAHEKKLRDVELKQCQGILTSLLKSDTDYGTNSDNFNRILSEADHRISSLFTGVEKKKSEIATLISKIAQEKSALNSLQEELEKSERLERQQAAKEQANLARRYKSQRLIQLRDDLSRKQQAELFTLRRQLAERDKEFREQLHQRQISIREAAEIRAQLEERLAHLKREVVGRNDQIKELRGAIEFHSNTSCHDTGDSVKRSSYHPSQVSAAMQLLIDSNLYAHLRERESTHPGSRTPDEKWAAMTSTNEPAGRSCPTLEKTKRASYEDIPEETQQSRALAHFSQSVGGDILAAIEDDQENHPNDIESSQLQSQTSTVTVQKNSKKKCRSPQRMESRKSHRQPRK